MWIINVKILAILEVDILLDINPKAFLNDWDQQIALLTITNSEVIYFPNYFEPSR